MNSKIIKSRIDMLHQVEEGLETALNVYKDYGMPVGSPNVAKIYRALHDVKNERADYIEKLPKVIEEEEKEKLNDWLRK